MKKIQAVILGLVLVFGAAVAVSQATEQKKDSCEKCCCCKGSDAACCKEHKK